MKIGQTGYLIENLTNELSSYYIPILFEIFLKSNNTSSPKPMYITDWKKFEIEMESIHYSLPTNSSKTQIDNVIHHLSSTISHNLELSSAL